MRCMVYGFPQTAYLLSCHSIYVTADKPYTSLFIFNSVALYLFLFVYVIPPYSSFLRYFFGLVSLFMVVTGFGLLLGQKWGRQLGLVVGLGLVGICFVLVAMLVSAIAYLKGVYGAFGTGASYASMVAIAIVIEVFGLPGAFQLRAMLRRDVKEHFAS